MESQLQAFIDQLAAEIEPIEKALHEYYWEASLTGSDEATQKVAEFETQYRLIFSDGTRFKRLKAFQESNQIVTPQLRRQLQLLILEFTSHQLPPEMIEDLVNRQTAIEQVFNTHRAVVDGAEMTDNEILEVLKREDRNERRRAVWEGSKQVGRKVAMDIIALAHQRNEAARTVGFDDYYQMSLKLSEVDEDELFQIVNRLESLTNEPFRRVKGNLDRELAARFGIAAENLRPWHYADPFFQEAPETGEVKFDAVFADCDLVAVTRDFFKGLGLSINDLIEKSDLIERPQKDQHAFCIHIDRKGDVRVLANTRPSRRWMETLLHEYGHAVYDKYLDAALPFLLRAPSHLITTEAIAMLMGRLARNAVWLDKTFHLSPEQKAAITANAIESFRLRTLIFVRWAMVMIHFEREFYRNPDCDVNTLWWSLVERFQFVTRPEGRNEPDWAAKIHISAAPVYYHNYLLGEMVASQLQHTIDWVVLNGQGVEVTGYINSPLVGDFLRKHVFKPGASVHWGELIKCATGELLNPQYLVDQLHIED
ncbi:MAG: M2 family metallopeptidase [Candidatus Poribacteria bacterium]|nr:M2 family metallopeptidase [Candidatus Poribacteria bacterium]